MWELVPGGPLKSMDISPVSSTDLMVRAGPTGEVMRGQLGSARHSPWLPGGEIVENVPRSLTLSYTLQTFNWMDGIASETQETVSKATGSPVPLA